MKKIILVIISLVLLSGCSANVKITMDKENKVSEVVSLTESNDIIEKNEMEKDEFLDSTYEFYYFDNLKAYKKEKKYNDLDTGFDFSKSTNGVCNAFNTSAFASFFDNLKCTEEKDYYEIKAQSEHMNCSIESSDCFNINDVTIEVNLPERAISSDADIIEDNKYIWKYSKGNEAIFNLKVKKYKTSDAIISKITSDKETNNTVKTMAILLGGFIVVIVIVVIILYGKYKNKKIDY